MNIAGAFSMIYLELVLTTLTIIPPVIEFSGVSPDIITSLSRVPGLRLKLGEIPLLFRRANNFIDIDFIHFRRIRTRVS